ncbi:N-6 DNA methylase [Planococcus shenhongbingii]|uniref:site-specific DNA-methyltransferase (adenine-specific) n=1 Tax=Planococcus shenhongbingii TaxID=3058398 RepID=A0ABT8NGS7_9BACL|nr:N-6 DNA methylase [Planococcus sp. N017]MDN7247107.1 N-6 DNA methylase [Planococcus sp. N017]
MSLRKIADVLRGAGESFGPVALAGLSLKYLEDELGEELEEKAKLSYLIKDAGNTVENLLNAFNLIEHGIPELEHVYKNLNIFWERIGNRALFEILLLIYKEDIIDYSSTVYSVRNLIMTSEGRRGGEHLTSNSLNHLQVTLLNVEDKTSFYDGVAGYGGSLIEVKRQHPEKQITLYGQELNKQSWAAGKLCLLMVGAKDVQFEQGNTLTDPLFKENERLKKFDYVAMTIPFGIRLDEQTHQKLTRDSFHRFSMGDLPRTSADIAFVQHALSSLTGKGRAVITISNGVLSRSGLEQSIRQNLVDTDQIEAVILLSHSLLQNTSIPISLLILNKDKPENKRGKIQFIQASELFEEQGRNRYLTDQHINKIHSMLDNAAEEEGFSKLVSITDLEESLNVARYIQTSEIEIENEGVYRIHWNRLRTKNDRTEKIQSLGSIYRGLNITSKNSEEIAEGEYKLIKLSDVQNGNVLLEALSAIEMKTNFKPALYQVQEDDVIVSARGTNVKVAVIPVHQETILLSQNFIGFRPEKNKVDPYFLQAYFESPIGQYQLSNLMAGTSVPVLNPKSFGTLEIALPSIDTQKDAATRYKRAKDQCEEALKEAALRLKEEKAKVYEELGILKAFELIESEK